MNFSKLSIKKIKNTENNSNSISDFEFNTNNNNYNNINNYGLYNNKEIIEENNILINTSNYIFEIKYTKMKSGNEYFTIFNNKGMYCIRIKKDIEYSNEIYLQYLNFFESCSKNKSLIKKTGTIEMLLCILQYVRDFYKKNLKYFFQDDSSINILDYKLNLNLIYILLYRESWYMKNINAIPYDNNYLKNLKFINEYLDNNKDNILKFFRKTIENNITEINNNNIFNKIISDNFIHLINKNDK